MTTSGVCLCGKKQYSTRKTAKIAAKKAFPGQHLSAYPCGNGWHIGHLPKRVILGDKDRNDIDRTPQPSGMGDRWDSHERRSNVGASRKRRGNRRRPLEEEDDL